MRFNLRARHQPPPSAETAAGESPRQGTGRRSAGWKLLVAWVIVPPVLLCLAELGLRLGGLGVSTQLFLQRDMQGESVCVTNRSFFQQFYTMPIVWEPHEFCMPATKPPDTHRVFVFGSSAAEGVPAPYFAFWRILGTMLRAEGHGGKTEIYSLAMAGANSHVMRAAAKACAAYQPDLFIVYMGNNELNPSVTQSMVWDGLPPWLSLRLLHLNIALNDLRLVQMLRGIRGPGDLNRPHGSDGNVREPERAYDYYQANVNDMCALAKAAGARVVLCTVGSRLREWMPEGEHAIALDADTARQWDAAYDAGKALRGQGRFQEALDAYARAAELDGSHAGLAYEIACCHYGLGQHSEARSWFVRARELDKAHNRAGNRINDIVRETAASRADDGVHLADTAKALADASPNGIEGPEFFLDPVHLTFEGNYTLAASVLKTLEGMLPGLETLDAPPSRDECKMRLAMTPPDLRDQLALTINLDAFMKGQSKDNIEQAVAVLDAQIGARAEDMRLEACRDALQVDPKNELVRIRYVEQLINKGDKANAFEQAKVLVADFPYSWKAHHLLAQMFAMTGDRGRAIEEVRLVLVSRSDDAATQLWLGELLCEDKQHTAALAAFRASFGLKPSAKAERGIARVLLKQGDSTGAVDAYRRSLELDATDAAVFEELITALCDANRLTEAKKEMERRRATGMDIPQRVWEKINGAPAPAAT